MNKQLTTVVLVVATFSHLSSGMVLRVQKERIPSIPISLVKDMVRSLTVQSQEDQINQHTNLLQLRGPAPIHPRLEYEKHKHVKELTALSEEEEDHQIKKKSP